MASVFVLFNDQWTAEILGIYSSEETAESARAVYHAEMAKRNKWWKPSDDKNPIREWQVDAPVLESA